MKSQSRIVILAALVAACVALLAACPGKGSREAALNTEAGTGLAADMRASVPVDASLLKKALSRAEEVEGSLVRGSIDFGSSTINYYEKKAGLAGGPEAGLAPEKGDLAIVDHGPEGELPIEMRRPTIYVMFNHPIVPLAKLGEPMTESSIMRIDPPVAGTYRWYGTRVLSFEPEGSLLASPRYEVRVSGSAKSLGGKKLGKDFSFSFYTETVKVVNHYPGNSTDTDGSTWEVPTAKARFVILEFNQEVDPEHIKKFITVKAGPRPMGFSVSRPSYPEALKTRAPRALLLTLAAEPMENVEVSVSLADKASPKKGWPERAGVQELSYRTVSPFRAEELSASAWDMPRNNKPGAMPVYARFSHELDAQAAKLPWGAAVDGKAVKPVALDLFGSVMRINIQDPPPGSEVAVTPPAALKDVYGRALSNAGVVLTCQIPEPYPHISFPSYRFSHLEAAYAPKLVWEARNQDSISLGRSASQAVDFTLLDDMRNGRSLPRMDALDLSSWARNRVRYQVDDLKPFLNPSSYGTVYYAWKSNARGPWGPSRESNAFAVQVTDIGITTRFAYNRALVWAASLSTGKPIAGASVELSGPSGSAGPVVTDSTGLAVIDFEGDQFASFFGGDYGYKLVVSVAKGADRAQMEAFNSHNSWGEGIYGHESPEDALEVHDRVMLFTDRGLYKPGEELALRGIHWLQDPSGFSPYAGSYSLRLEDPRDGRLLWSQEGTASASGGLAHRFVLPAGIEPGSYWISYRARGGEDDWYGVGFTVAMFRRLAFQVKSTVPDRPFFLGDEASVSVEASYLAGGPMQGASYDYYWTRSPAAYAPPGTQWKGWVFGPGNWEGQRSLSSGQGKLSPTGKVTLSERTEGQNAAGSAYSYTLETTVQDIDRQAVSSTASVLVHPASFYVGARFASGSSDGWWSRFVSTGREVKLEAALVQSDGTPWERDAKLKATILLGSWKSTEQQGVYGRVNTRWEYVEEEVQSADIVAKGGKATWSFKVKDSGDYILNLEGKDAKGRLSKTSLRFYATGSSWARRATETPSTIQLMPDREEYLPGQTARILVKSPLPSGSYLLTVEREGIQSQSIVQISDKEPLIEFPITEAHVPVVYVALSGYTKREAAPSDYFEPDLGKPRSLFGITGLKVSTRPVELSVEVSAVEGAYRPGTEAEVLVKVTRDGKPVSDGEVTLMAVDRGVLDLIDYHVPDPVAFFYDPSNFPLGVHGDDSRRLLLKPVTYDTSVLTGGADDKIRERKDFRPLALFEPFARTDEKGEVRVKFKLPDSLTTYRLTAVALQGARLGLKEGELLVQNPVNVRAALPRRFRNRDTAAAGVVMQNLTTVSQKVEVTAQSDILTISGEATRSVVIPPKGVYELPFLLQAKEPGAGTISFTVRSAVVNERLVEQVVVERPLVTEAFATVGSIARDASSAQEGIVIPSAIAPGYGSLSIKASSSLKPWIEPALDRLLQTPEPWWGYYMRLTHAFASVYASKDEALVRSLLRELAGRQLPEGGIYTGSWSWRPYLPDPYTSLLAAHFLQFAESRRWKAAEGPDRSKLLRYLEGLKADDKLFDPYFKAYLAYVLSASGRRDPAFLKTVEGFEDKLGLGGYGLLAQACLASGDSAAAARVYRRSKNFVLMGTQKVDVKDSYEVTGYWTSLLAEMGIMLRNAFELEEDTGFVQRLAGSMDRSERYWRTRNDDLWTLLGFMPLLDAEGSAAGVADFTVTAGTAELMKERMTAARPETARSFEFNAAPLAGLERDKLLPLALGKTGDTPLYYTSILRYALPNESALARDEGIEVALRYETLDGAKVEDDGLEPGQTYRVRVNVSTTKRRQRLELLVPVPNGVEIVDPTFVTSGRFGNSGGAGSDVITRETVYGDVMDVYAEGTGTWDGDSWYWYWYNPDSFALDNMMVYRWTDFYAGRREVTFLVRATTPGIWPTPPASASLEFEPEVFGRSEGKLFVIKP